MCICASCAVVYVPNSRNAPMLSSKGEIQCSAATGIGNNLQTAYAFTDHFGAMANGMNVNNSTFGKHTYGEVGLGYYQNIKTKMKKGYLYADIFGGYGVGSLNVYRDNGPKDLVDKEWYQGNYQKFFIQPGVAYKLDQLGAVKLYLGIVHRFSLVDFSRVNGLVAPASNSPASPFTFSKSQVFFHEPSFVFKAIYKNFYLTCQGGVNITFQKTDDLFNYSPLQFSIGAGVLLNLKKRRK
jgi:hypothetical protein